MLALVLIGSLTGIYSEYRWRKLFASIIENSEKDTDEIGRQRGIIWSHEHTIRDHKAQITERDETIDGLIARIESTKESYRTKQAAIKESDAAYETLRIDYDQLHAAHKLLKNGVDMMIGELNAMTLQRDRLLEVIKLRDEKLDKLVARDNELISYIDGLKYSIKTRGGQVPDLNAAWHTKEKPVDVKQKYLLDDTPLDDNGSGVIDS